MSGAERKEQHISQFATDTFAAHKLYLLAPNAVRAVRAVACGSTHTLAGPFNYITF